MRIGLKIFAATVLPWCCMMGTAAAEIVTVTDTAGLKLALSNLKPGTVLRIGPGEYSGGHHVQSVADLTIEAADEKQPPVFQGGTSGWHFSGCSGLKLRHLQISGQRSNGLNLDDGGVRNHAMQNVTIEHLTVTDIGPRGNVDPIKCSGLQDLTIRSCTIAGWGGQGIDLVGCHRVLITNCSFTGKDGFTHSAGVQCKGGSEDVVIEKCKFQNAGERPINAGGSTGIPYFRPPGAKYEARRIVIRENQISGSLCACAFVGVDGAQFENNTVEYPERWIFRILQETNADGFIPCRNVRISNNRIVFRRSQVRVDVNIGGGTEPETFAFSGNQWFAEDRPERSKPALPTEETNGKYGQDPRKPRPRE